MQGLKGVLGLKVCRFVIGITAVVCLFAFGSGIYALWNDEEAMKTLINMGRFNFENGEPADYANKNRLLREVRAKIEQLEAMNMTDIKSKLREFMLDLQYCSISKELKHISETSHSRKDIIHNLRCMANAYASMCG